MSKILLVRVPFLSLMMLSLAGATGCATTVSSTLDDDEVIVAHHRPSRPQVEAAARSLWFLYSQPRRHRDSADRDAFRALVALDVAIDEMKATGDARPVAEVAYCAVNAVGALYDPMSIPTGELSEANRVFDSLGYDDVTCRRLSLGEQLQFVNNIH